MDAVKVLVGGLEFNNFEQMRIFSDLHSLADTFSFAGVISANVSPFVAGKTVKCGDRCVITINAKTVMNGYVSDTRLSLDAEGGTMFDFSGVDTCGWVSRLSAANTTEGDYTPAQILNFLRAQIPALANVTVLGLDGLGVMQEFQMNVGDSVSSIFEAIADKTNTLFYANQSGAIVFGRKSRGGAFHEIVVGKDRVKSVSASKSVQDVFDEVVYKCEDDYTGIPTPVAAHVPFVPLTGAKRYVRASQDAGDVLKSAQNEANTIIANYLKVSVEYAGFTDSAGRVWQINKPLTISGAAESGIYNGNLVVESVEFSQTRNEGQVANLTLTLPAGY